jgi:outer membrane protein TolC
MSRYTIFLIMPLTMLLAENALAQESHVLPLVRVGIVLDGPEGEGRAFSKLAEQEILELTRGEFDIRFPVEKMIVADWTLGGVSKAVDQLLNDPEVDILLANGLIASHVVCHRGRLPKPVIAPFVIDAKLQELPIKDGASGVENLNYVSFPAGMKRDVEAFLDVVPFTKLVVLVNRHYPEAIPELMNLVTDLEVEFQEIGLELEIIPIDRSVDQAFAVFPSDAEAVYVTPLVHIAAEEFDHLLDILIDRKLPSFSLFGVLEVERGILAGLKPDIFPKLARRIALNVQRILLGEEAGSLPVSFAIGEQFTINMATARKIGVSPGWGVLTEAEQIQQERKDVERELDLESVVREAVDANLDLAAKERFVAAGRQNISEARSSLFPQVDISSLGLVIDEDRASASFGQQAERTVSGSISATQIIYSEPAWANLEIQKELQKTREWERKQLELDIVAAATTAYLNVLRSKTFERIQTENLKRTRSNLELARVREVVGSAGPAEVYRWESQVATNRKTVIEANSQRNLAEIELNRLLNRPLEEPFRTLEVDIHDPVLMITEEKLFWCTRDPVSFRIFREFMVREGLNASPELEALDAAILARERIHRSATHSLWSPTIALFGEVTNRFSREGAGAESFDSSQLPFSLPQVDDTDWSVGLNISFPLFRGGSKYAVRERAHEELFQLRIERNAAAERIEQRVRNALHNAGASFAGIEQSLAAAEAADKSLEVVNDAYGRGVVSIIDLLDAQNNALVAELLAANAVYDFLIDLMEVERSIGQFDFFRSEENRQAFYERLELHYKNSDLDR